MQSTSFLLRCALAFSVACLISWSHAGTPLPRSTPEAQGIDSGHLQTLVRRLHDEVQVMNSFMVLRHGKVVAEGWWHPYRPEDLHRLYSLSKSFTSTAVGLAVDEGRIGLHDRILNFFPEQAPSDPSLNLQSMRVIDLLTMTAGHETEPSAAPDRVNPAAFLKHAVPREPGTHFRYNTAATFMLAAIVEKVTGQGLVDYLQPRLFEPLGIENPQWATNSGGVALGGYGLRVRTEDIAKFGQLYLQEGRWGNKRLLSSSWVRMATSGQVPNGSNPDSDWNQGYGFQFWRCRHDAYRGDGAFGQYCLVLPEQDAVVAITSGTGDMQKVLNILWESLLPTFKDEPLEPNPEAAAELKATLSRMRVPVADGNPTGPGHQSWMNRTYKFEANEDGWETLQCQPSSEGQGLRLEIVVNGEQRVYECSHGKWMRGGEASNRVDGEWVAGSYGWLDGQTCQVKLCAYNTPFLHTWTLGFGKDGLELERETNVAFGPRKQATLTATLDGTTK